MGSRWGRLAEPVSPVSFRLAADRKALFVPVGHVSLGAARARRPGERALEWSGPKGLDPNCAGSESLRAKGRGYITRRIWVTLSIQIPHSEKSELH